MLGGYQILDLRGIDLTISESASDITNANVLNQLLKLRDYIDKAYNFSKPLENQLKPVLIRFRDKKANEKIEGATFGELSVVDNYYSFKITARLSGVLVLTINVTFEEVENGYGNMEWIIDDATIQLADETQTISGDLEVTGDLSVSSDAEVTGDLSVGDDVEITGDVSVGGNLSVTGSINGVANPSVKPIYYHPIYCVIGIEGVYNKLVFQCVILDNSATAYSETPFINKLKELMDLGALINVNGYYKDSNNEYAAVMVLYKSGSTYTGDTFKPTSSTSFDFSQLLEDMTSIAIVDGVNKIN